MTNSLPGGAAPGTITVLLQRCRAGDRSAKDKVFAQLYAELKRLAASVSRHSPRGGTLSATALVNEAYLKLAPANWDFGNRSQFKAVAAKAMRQILVDDARRRCAYKRGGGQRARVTLDESLVSDDGQADPLTLIALHDALESLSARNERWARVVELRYFGGLINEEIAEVLDITTKTVVRDWNAARNFLLAQIEQGSAV